MKKRGVADQNKEIKTQKIGDKKKHIPSISLFKPQNIVSPEIKPGSFIKTQTTKDLKIDT